MCTYGLSDAYIYICIYIDSILHAIPCAQIEHMNTLETHMNVYPITNGTDPRPHSKSVQLPYNT